MPAPNCGNRLVLPYRTRTVGIHFVTLLGADEEYRKLSKKSLLWSFVHGTQIPSLATSWETVFIDIHVRIGISQ